MQQNYTAKKALFLHVRKSEISKNLRDAILCLRQKVEKNNIYLISPNYRGWYDVIRFRPSPNDLVHSLGTGIIQVIIITFGRIKLNSCLVAFLPIFLTHITLANQ